MEEMECLKIEKSDIVLNMIWNASFDLAIFWLFQYFFFFFFFKASLFFGAGIKAAVSISSSDSCNGRACAAETFGLG